MFVKSALAFVAVLSLVAPAFAAGDPAVGEKEFNKCKACHSIIAADETAIVKGGKVGPNLFGVIGRAAGSYPEFKYSESMLAAGAKGLIWDETEFTAYVMDPTKYLRTYLGDDKAKGAMAFKLTKKMEDVYAYLVSVAPPAE